MAQAEVGLANATFVVVHEFERDGRPLTLAITDRLRRTCKKARVWQSKPLLTALKNAEYGFDPNHLHSSGGADGLFLLTRDFRPRNEMMKKLFDRYLDKMGSGAELIADEMRVPLAELLPVRLVSHHMRLLGLLRHADGGDFLVLVDFDDTK